MSRFINAFFMVIVFHVSHAVLLACRYSQASKLHSIHSLLSITERVCSHVIVKTLLRGRYVVLETYMYSGSTKTESHTTRM